MLDVLTMLQQFFDTNVTTHSQLPIHKIARLPLVSDGPIPILALCPITGTTGGTLTWWGGGHWHGHGQDHPDSLVENADSSYLPFAARYQLPG